MEGKGGGMTQYFFPLGKKTLSFFNTKINKSDYISKTKNRTKKKSCMQKNDRQVNSILPCKFVHFWRKLNFWAPKTPLLNARSAFKRDNIRTIFVSRTVARLIYVTIPVFPAIKPLFLAHAEKSFVYRDCDVSYSMQWSS